MDNKTRENLINNTALVNLSLTESVTLGIHKSYVNPKNHVVTIWKGGREKSIILTEEKLRDIKMILDKCFIYYKLDRCGDSNHVEKTKYKCKADSYNCTLTVRIVIDNMMIILTLREGKIDDFHYVLHGEELKTFLEYIGKIK